MSFSIDGLGMDNQTTNCIFNKFPSWNSSHFKVGNGLGLPLVKCIVKLCGDDAIVHCKIGKGSNFIVILPIVN
ncbi:ATP-binding protein [Psychrobacillus sp. NPDC096389]|uniref:ATP-binding protein n=1 Tax=Psychrobacillus sp. NPDC096389 TaxID=3364490 RepID=UPI0038045413